MHGNIRKETPERLVLPQKMYNRRASLPHLFFRARAGQNAAAFSLAYVPFCCFNA
jgi:hypothetical protein